MLFGVLFVVLLGGCCQRCNHWPGLFAIWGLCWMVSLENQKRVLRKDNVMVSLENQKRVLRKDNLMVSLETKRGFSERTM